MKRSSILIAAILLLGANLWAQAGGPPPGFVALFNGENLDGWWGLKTENPAKWMALSPEDFEAKRKASLADIKAHWRAENGILVNDGHGMFLTTDKNYGDFELLLEYKTVALADSGIYLRGIPQVQIWDSTEERKFKLGADKGSGGLWNNPGGWKGKDPLVLADKPFGEWNSMRIQMVGEYVTVDLNDKRVVDHARLSNYFGRKQGLPVPPTGPIQLQTHGGEISWRNIFIREIDAEEANQILAAEAGDGFASLYDGKSATGWKGATANCEFSNGMIQNKKGKGGAVFTEKTFSDFTVQFEFKLPPGGNNGLAIRYPGKGNPAYAGMCELQVLDNTAEKFAKLDVRQYHGSAYGMVPAHRGYLRALNAWNFQVVEVVGPAIKVELNGTRILDTDLSKVTEYMGNKKHPGKELKSGHFGFAGHGDPVAFRNIKIEEMN